MRSRRGAIGSVVLSFVSVRALPAIENQGVTGSSGLLVPGV